MYKSSKIKLTATRQCCDWAFTGHAEGWQFHCHVIAGRVKQSVFNIEVLLCLARTRTRNGVAAFTRFKAPRVITIAISVYCQILSYG